MRTPVAAVALISAVLLVGGCETAPAPAPTKPAAPKPVATAPTLATPTVKQPVIQSAPPKEAPPAVSVPTANIPAPKLSPEAAALIERLTHPDDPDTLPHEVADTTGFAGALKSLEPGAPAPKVESTPNTDPSAYQAPARGLTADGNTTALIERDWTGLVLVPISTALSKAHTSDVRLTKVEAHPLNDGRVRVWARVSNLGRDPLPSEIACEFRMKGSRLSSPYFYQFEVPGNGYRDVFFISPDGQLSAYTVLVRSADAVRR